MLLGSTAKHIYIPFVLTHFIVNLICSSYRPWFLPPHWRIFHVNIVCHITFLIFYFSFISNYIQVNIYIDPNYAISATEHNIDI